MPFFCFKPQAKFIALVAMTWSCLIFVTTSSMAAGAGGGGGGGGGGAGAAAGAGGTSGTSTTSGSTGRAHGGGGSTGHGGGGIAPPMSGAAIRGGGPGAGLGGAPISSPLGGSHGAGAGGSSGLGTTLKPVTGPINMGTSRPGAGTAGSTGAAGAAGSHGKGTSPVQMGSGRTPAAPPARYEMVNGTIVPNTNVGYYGQFPAGAASPSAAYNPMNLNQPFQPSYGPAVNFNTQAPFMPPPMAMPEPPNPILGCIQGLANMVTAQSQIHQMQMLADEANERKGPRSHPSFNRAANREILSGFSKSEGDCQKFIDNNGHLGAWGDTLLGCMKSPEARDVYGYTDSPGAAGNGLEPSDVYRYCPSFGKMDQARRDRFWVWFFMSVAGPESSCNPGNVGQGPNGNAIGLFQLEADKCNNVGERVSSADLMRADPNIRCACKLFAKEMRNRDTIFIGTSRGRAGTYWGTLRSDRSSAQDGPANAKTMRTLASYSDCYH